MKPAPRYIVPNYVRKADRVMEVFNGRPSVISMDKIASFDGAAHLGYFLTHMTEDEKKRYRTASEGDFYMKAFKVTEVCTENEYMVGLMILYIS